MRVCIFSFAIVVCMFFSAPAFGVIVQTVAGPNVASGGGEGSTLIDQSNDTGNWIDTLNTGSTYYFSFNWTINNNAGETGSGGFFGGMAFYDGTTERLLLGNGWTSLNYSAGQGGTIESTSIPYSVGQSVTIVARITTVDPGNDSWAMWVNPQNSDEGDPLITRTDWTIDNFTKLTNRAGDGSGQATLSNLNVATTWNDVVVAVPEPSAFLFGGLICTVLGANYVRKRMQQKAA